MFEVNLATLIFGDIAISEILVSPFMYCSVSSTENYSTLRLSNDN